MKTLHATHGADCLWGLGDFFSYHATGLASAVALAFAGALLLAQLTHNRRFW
nr:MAG TPA: hypothetical protein [Caudoviricetes sp.]